MEQNTWIIGYLDRAKNNIMISCVSVALWQSNQVSEQVARFDNVHVIYVPLPFMLRNTNTKILIIHKLMRRLYRLLIIHKLMTRLQTGERALSCVVIISLSFIALVFCLLFFIVLFNAQQQHSRSKFTTGIADSNNS